MERRVRAKGKGLFLCGALAALILSLGLTAHLNAQVVGATLSGTITDESGAVIPNAKIQAKNTATGVISSGVTDSKGFYTIPNLTAGAYDVTASAKGFSTQIQPGITLTVGGQQVLNWIMKVGQVTQQIQVTGAAPTVDLANAAIGATTFETTVKQLPLNGRSWSDLANLQPGVYAIKTQPSVSIRDRWNRGYGAQVSISGARPQQNNYRLDGISINDPTNGGPGSVIGGNLGVDAIAEFSVLTTNYSTEYGRSSGGIINAITKSGTNQFHGDAYEFLRNSSLDAANFFDVTKPPFRRNQFGASAGGPIQKDKTFIFGDYEGLRQALNLSQVSTVPSVNARNGILSTGNVTVDPAVARYLVFYPLPNQAIAGAPDFGHFAFPDPQVSSENFFITRLDHTFSEKDSMHGTYFYDFANTVTGDEFHNKDITTLVHRQFVTVEEDHVFSPSVFNSVRVGFDRYFVGGPGGVTAVNPAAASTAYSFAPGNVWTSGQIGVTGLTLFSGGLTAASPQLSHWNDWQAYDEVFFTRGVHSIKFGGNVERIEDNTFSSPRPGGVFLFSSLSDFLTNNPKSLSSDLPANVAPREPRQSIFGLFIQDDARVKPNLTLNMGLLYQPASVPNDAQGKQASLILDTNAFPHTGAPLFNNNTLRDFDPRVGFAWDPFHSGKTSIRGGFGFYDQLPLIPFMASAIPSTYPFLQSGNASLTGFPGSFPTAAFALVESQGPDSKRVAVMQQNPGRGYVMQWNFNIQRQIKPSLTATIGYVGSHGVHGITQDDDINIVFPTSTSIGYMWPCGPPLTSAGNCTAGGGTKFNTHVGRMPTTLFRNSSIYNGLIASVTQTMSHGLQAQGSFSWTKCLDTASGATIGDQTINGISSIFVFNPSLSHGLCDFNSGAVFTLNALWSIPVPASFTGIARGVLGGWQMGGIFTAADGVPFTPFTAPDPMGLNNSDPFAYPDRLTGPGCQSLLNPGNVNNYIKLNCFSNPVAPASFAAQCAPALDASGNPVAGTCMNLLGNAGRNIIPGPGLAEFDFSLVKDTPVKSISESFDIEFRAEFFNILNRPNFNPPIDNATLFNGVTNVPIGGAGAIDATATTSRQLQFAIKVIW